MHQLIGPPINAHIEANGRGFIRADLESQFGAGHGLW